MSEPINLDVITSIADSLEWQLESIDDETIFDPGGRTRRTIRLELIHPENDVQEEPSSIPVPITRRDGT